MARAQYMRVATTNEIVWLVDRDSGMSVTNDAEAVVAEVHALCPGRRIIYRDTDGNWDELVHKDGVFVGFKPARDLPAPGFE